MVTAYQNMGAKDLVEQAAKTPASWNEPTLEQALVVPEFPHTGSSQRVVVQKDVRKEAAGC